MIKLSNYRWNKKHTISELRLYALFLFLVFVNLSKQNDLVPDIIYETIIIPFLFLQCVYQLVDEHILVILCLCRTVLHIYLVLCEVIKV